MCGNCFEVKNLSVTINAALTINIVNSNNKATFVADKEAITNKRGLVFKLI